MRARGQRNSNGFSGSMPPLAGDGDVQAMRSGNLGQGRRRRHTRLPVAVFRNNRQCDGHRVGGCKEGDILRMRHRHRRTEDLVKRQVGNGNYRNPAPEVL